jgi:hypothetical protein
MKVDIEVDQQKKKSLLRADEALLLCAVACYKQELILIAGVSVQEDPKGAIHPTGREWAIGIEARESWNLLR